MKAVKNQKGFTLIETLVSMMLIAVTLVMIMQTFSSGLRSVNVSEYTTAAVFHATEKMEEIFLYKALSPGVTTGEIDGVYRWETEIKKNEEALDLDRVKDEKKNDGQYDLFFVTVMVSWKVGSTEKNFKLSTLRSMIY